MEEDELKNLLVDCPFCRSGHFRTRENKMWTGTRSIVFSAELTHVCSKGQDDDQLDTVTIVTKSATMMGALEKWGLKSPPNTSR